MVSWRNYFTAELSLRRSHNACVVHSSILGQLLKELAWLDEEITLKPSCPCRDHTPCMLLTDRFLGFFSFFLKDLAWLVGEITLKPCCPYRDRTPCVVDWSSLGLFFFFLFFFFFFFGFKKK